MRALIATAGFFVLVGAAAAGPPVVHTLRTSGSGPIVAVAQDGAFVAWLASSSRACDAVHMLARGKRDVTLPQPSAGSLTCHWDLDDGQPQLAVAARASMALWTLHESGPAPIDYVLAARVGGPEKRIDRLTHASTGTGYWLGGVAGAGRTLAYSYVDVEYVDQLACLSGGSCAQRIAGGGIRVVSRSAVETLPTAEPALELAAAGGRLAYVPAAAVGKNGEPVASAAAPLEVIDPTSGAVLCRIPPRGLPLAIALSGHVLAVLTQNGRKDRIAWYDPVAGTKLGAASVSGRTAPELAASDHLVVYRVGRVLRGISTANGHGRMLTKAAPNSVGLSLENDRLVWAENRAGGGRLRTLSVS